MRRRDRYAEAAAVIRHRRGQPAGGRRHSGTDRPARCRRELPQPCPDPVICVAKQQIPRPHNNMSEAALFYKSAPGWPGPDMQMAFVHGSPPQARDEPPPDVMVMLPGVVRPLSRGWVRLASADPFAKPLINPNYLAVDADHRRLTEGVRLARRIYSTRAFADWVQAEVLPGPNVGDAQLGDDVRARAESYHHQAILPYGRRCACRRQSRAQGARH